MKNNYFTFLIIFAISIVTNTFATNLGDNDICSAAIAISCNNTIVGTTADNTDTGFNDAPDEYFIFTGDGFAANSGDFSLSISCTGPPMPPPNDLIENAIDISDVLQNATAGEFIDPAVNAQDATPEDGLPSDCDLAGIDGFWYYFTVNGGFVVNASIESPLGISAVIFFTAPNDTATLEDLTRVDITSNPCFTGDNAEITANTPA